MYYKVDQNWWTRWSCSLEVDGSWFVFCSARSDRAIWAPCLSVRWCAWPSKTGTLCTSHPGTWVGWIPLLVRPYPTTTEWSNTIPSCGNPTPVAAVRERILEWIWWDFCCSFGAWGSHSPAYRSYRCCRGVFCWSPSESPWVRWCPTRCHSVWSWWTSSYRCWKSGWCCLQFGLGPCWVAFVPSKIDWPAWVPRWVDEAMWLFRLSKY